MTRTSLASCASKPEFMYAVASGVNLNQGQQSIYAVLGSDDNGTSWKLVPGSQSLSGQAGGHGYYNNCVAVAPGDPKQLLIGWQNGTFQSRDSGTSFAQLNVPGLHSDVHGLYLDPANSTNNTFYVCSDGGTAKTKDGGATFDSSFNRYLTNLECYCGFDRVLRGSLSVRGDFMASGLQDNSNVYCVLRPYTPGVNPWVQVEGCDGGWVALLATGQLITTANCPSPTSASSYVPRRDFPHEFGKGGTVPVRDNNGDDATGLVAFAVEPILRPMYGNMVGQKMYAVARGQRSTEAGTGAGKLNVYGAFANDNGSDLHWAQIGIVPSDLPGDTVNALATLDDGTSVLAGTGKGLIFLLRPLPGVIVTAQKAANFSAARDARERLQNCLCVGDAGVCDLQHERGGGSHSAFRWNCLEHPRDWITWIDALRPRTRRLQPDLDLHR
jgi:hypothetical protein